MSPKDFLKLVAASGLVDTSHLRIVVAGIAKDDREVEAMGTSSLADYLVERGVLTSWQRGKLMEGRYKGFFLGKYKLLGYLRSRPPSQVYEAEDTRRGERVEITVTPEPDLIRFTVTQGGRFVREDTIPRKPSNTDQS